MCINSFGKIKDKKKTKPNQNFSGEMDFFQRNINSRCKHVTDNKLQVCYWECHLPGIRSVYRLPIHFQNHIYL